MSKQHEVTIEEFKKSSRERSHGSYSGGRYYPSSAGDRPSDPMRVFIDFKGESIWDNLNNRTQRPHTTLKPMLAKLLEEEGITYEKIRWSQKAGCRMCPCSPGFIVEGTSYENRQDFWITVWDKTEYDARPGL